MLRQVSRRIGKTVVLSAAVVLASPVVSAAAPGAGDEKECKTCDTIAAWGRAGRARRAKTEQKSSPPPPPLEQQQQQQALEVLPCPASLDQLGNAGWTLLHTIAAYYPEHPSKQDQQHVLSFLQSMSLVYPCKTCAEDFHAYLTSNPPDVSSRTGLEQWMCRAHNAVNVKLGKPEFQCQMTRQRWREGDPETCL